MGKERDTRGIQVYSVVILNAGLLVAKKLF
jgi:hypothetical protein